MAFPTIPTVAAGRILFTLNTAGGATKTFPNLSSLTKNAGDLLIAIIFEYDGNSTDAEFSNWGGGFTEIADRAGTATGAIGVAWKISTGSETGTFTVTTADTSVNDSVLVLLSIPGAHATSAPEVSVLGTGTGASPQPPSVTASWGAEDNLFIAVGGSGEDSTTGSYTGVTGAPTSYTDYADSGITGDYVGGVELALAFRQLAADTDDPANFTGDGSNVRYASVTIVVRPAAAVNNYSLDCQPGSFTLTGVLTGVPAGRVVSASPGSYALSGLAAGVVAGRAISAVPAAYALTGSVAGVLTTRLISSLPGSYVITGIDATLLQAGGGPTDYPLNAEPGAFTLSGVAAGVVAGRIVVALPGAYVLTGVAVTILADRAVSASPGAFALTGQSAGVVAGRMVSASPGSYALTGVAATNPTTRVMNAGPGSFALTGVSAGLVHTVPGGSTSRNRTLLGVGQ